MRTNGKSMNRTAPARIAGSLWAIVLAASGCSGDDGGGGVPGGGTGGDLFAIIEAANDRLDELQVQSDVEVIGEMYAFLVGTGAFEQVDVSSDGTVWGRMPDGRLYMIVTNRRDEGDAAADGGGDLGGSRQELRSALPDAPTIAATALFDGLHDDPGLHPRLSDTATEILSWATANGYRDRGFTGTVDDFERLQDVGILYIDTHGGAGRSKEGEDLAAIWTGTRITREYLEREDSRFRSGELVAITSATYRNPSRDDRVGITGRFVAQHMHFAQDSFVFVNACSSNHPSLVAAFRAAGAGVYAGWSSTVYDDAAHDVARFVFDRLLGANRVGPVSGGERRPLPLDVVAQELRDRGMNPTMGTRFLVSTGPARDIHVVGGGTVSHGLRWERRREMVELVFNRADPDVSLLLVPSLVSVTVNEAVQTLTAVGELGTPPYDVWLDGQRLTAISSTSRGTIDEVVAQLPPGVFSGPVHVESMGRHSNTKMLSGWRFNVRWHKPLTGSVVLSAECELRFRAAPRGVRAMPTDETVPILDDIRADLAEGSQCTLSASGAETWTDATGTHTAVWSPARSAPYTTADLAPSFVYLGLHADGRWNLHAPIQLAGALTRTIDGRPESAPWGVGVAFGDADSTTFDPERFDIPGGTARDGDVEITWEPTAATPTPEHGEGLTPAAAMGGGGGGGGGGSGCSEDASVPDGGVAMPGGADAGCPGVDGGR